MRSIFILLALFPSIGICQKKTGGGFESIGITMLLRDGSPSFGAAAAVGFGNRSVTFGLGGELYSFESTRSAYLPVFAHLKIYVGQQQVRPYATLAAGHGIYSDGSTHGGLYYAASVGLHIKNAKKPRQPGVYFQAGLKNLSFRPNYRYSDVRVMNRYLSLDLGLRF